MGRRRAKNDHPPASFLFDAKKKRERFVDLNAEDQIIKVVKKRRPRAKPGDMLRDHGTGEQYAARDFSKFPEQVQ